MDAERHIMNSDSKENFYCGKCGKLIPCEHYGRVNSDSPTKGKAYPVCNDCKNAGKWDCPHLNSDSVDKIDEIILKPAHWQYDDYQKAKAALLALLEAETVGYIGKANAGGVMYTNSSVPEPAIPLSKVRELFNV